MGFDERVVSSGTARAPLPTTVPPSPLCPREPRSLPQRPGGFVVAVGKSKPRAIAPFLSPTRLVQGTISNNSLIGSAAKVKTNVPSQLRNTCPTDSSREWEATYSNWSNNSKAGIPATSNPPSAQSTPARVSAKAKKGRAQRTSLDPS